MLAARASQRPVFPYPPFAKSAKDGAPIALPIAGESKSMGHCQPAR